MADAADCRVVRERLQDAQGSMRRYEAEPLIRCWADADDVTLFGASGPIEIVR